jgi:nucleotide-binding universal stress UspA family protein
MYRHILIYTDGSPLSTVAVEQSMDFARDALDCDGITWPTRVAAIVLGSEALKVLTHSKIPVLIYR